MNNKKNDPFANLFAQLPEEKLSSSFRMQMMQQVIQERTLYRKRNRQWGIAGLMLAILTLLGAGIWGLLYIDWSFLRIPEAKVSVTLPSLASFSFYIYISILAGILLCLDYLFRKYFFKKEKKELS